MLSAEPLGLGHYHVRTNGLERGITSTKYHASAVSGSGILKAGPFLWEHTLQQECCFVSMLMPAPAAPRQARMQQLNTEDPLSGLICFWWIQVFHGPAVHGPGLWKIDPAS